MICHSLGGLVCHAYLNDQIESEYLPLKVVCLGTPFKGSMVAKNLARYLPGKILLGAQASSVLVTGLKEWRSYCRLGIIAGSKNVGAGRLLGLDSHRPADGTVLVEETKIEGASDHIILPVSHSQMTFSTKVNLQIEHFMSNDIFKHENP